MFISIHGTIDARETLQQLREELGMLKMDVRTFTVSIDDTADVDDAVLEPITEELDEIFNMMEETFLARVRLLGQKHKVKLTATMTD